MVEPGLLGLSTSLGQLQQFTRELPLHIYRGQQRQQQGQLEATH